MAPPPTTPAPRLSENNIGGGRRSPLPRRDWLLAPLTHTAARALPRGLTGSVVCAGRAGRRLRVPPGDLGPAGPRCGAVPVSGAIPALRGYSRAPGPFPCPGPFPHSGVIPALRGHSRVPGPFPPHGSCGTLLGEQLSALRSVPGATAAPQVRRTGRENLQLLDHFRGFCLSVVVLDARSRSWFIKSIRNGRTNEIASVRDL
ncbi:uncharacterized protein [Taeniopygia guttata]|uniref:uncharacterized protein n=1 Tax=Taeniopygia guttata TaxID=59729 RepID=UPI003BB988B1